MSKGPKKDFFKIKNLLWEALEIDFKLPTADRRVLGYVVRWTYGLKARDRMVLDRGKCSERLGVSERTVESGIASLAKNKALICFEKGRRGSPSVYGPNPDFGEWLYPRFPDQTDRGNSTKQTQKNPDQTDRGNFPDQTDRVKGQIARSDRSGKSDRTDRGNSAANPDGCRAEATPERHVFKDMRSKDMEKEAKKGAKTEDETATLPLKIFKTIGERYFPIQGPPRINFEDCRKLVDLYSHEIEHLKTAFTLAWRAQLKWEDEAGKRTYKPFRLLDETAKILADHGIQPRDQATRRETA